MSGQRSRSRSSVRSSVWGWHPLRPAWAARLVAESPAAPGDFVLDLGAGTGELTAPLLAVGCRVLAVERHPARAARLRARFVGESDVRVLELDLRQLRWPRHPFAVLSSPPYGLTTALVRDLLAQDRLRWADLVVQHGAAIGLAATPPRARHTRRYRLSTGRAIGSEAFRIPPRVDSRVLRIRH